jgi:hypothetical protein
MPIPILTLCLFLAEPPVEARVVAFDGWLHVTHGDGEAYVIFGPRTRVTWALDPRVQLPRSELRRGARVRYLPSCCAAKEVQVVTLGPLAMEAAVEDFVSRSAGGRAWLALDADELAEVERLGAPCFAIRRGATERLRRRGGGAIRALIWARHSRDPETRLRAAGLLAEMGWP